MSVLVVGDAGLDITVVVDHRPDADEKVHALHELRHAGGVAANTAVGLARLGSLPLLAAALGDDPFGELVQADLAAEGLDPALVRRLPGESTYYSVSLVDAAGEKALVVVPCGRLYPTAEQLPATLPGGVRWLHTVPYDVPLATAWTDLARAAQVPISIDLEPATMSGGIDSLRPVLQDADTVMINRRAVERSGLREDELMSRLSGWGVRNVLRTGGPSGVVLWQGGSAALPVTPPPIDVVDTTGAGDALAAGYIHARLTGQRVSEAVRYGCIAGALACTVLGAQAALPDADAVEAMWRREPTHI